LCVSTVLGLALMRYVVRFPATVALGREAGSRRLGSA
jgi:hypothetical protein